MSSLDSGDNLKAALGCLVILLIVAAIPGFFFLFWWSFNTFSPVFGGPVLTFWQAFAGYVLLLIVGQFFKATVTSK